MPMYPMVTAEDRERFITSYRAGRYFTTGSFVDKEHPFIMYLVFPTLQADLHDAGIDPKRVGIGGVFEYADKADGVITSPWTGHQYPTFPTCNIVLEDEWTRMVDNLELLEWASRDHL